MQPTSTPNNRPSSAIHCSLIFRPDPITASVSLARMVLSLQNGWNVPLKRGIWFLENAEIQAQLCRKLRFR
jgi:hypothetical protein